jgi:hypothetical protein
MKGNYSLGGMTMANDEERKAKIAINDTYQKGVNSILTLSTATLLLPIVFFRDVVGITGKNVIGGYLHGIISSWIPLLLSIAFCIAFYFFSAVHIKSLHNLDISRFWKNHSEAFCRWSFWLSATFFGFGVLYLVIYVYLLNFRFY